MRLISQDGFIDVPYEQIGLSIRTTGTRVVLISHCVVSDASNIMGSYSSKEKALKVMEMVRNAYTGSSLTVFKDYSMEDTKELMELMKKSNAVVLESGNKQPEFHHCVGNTIFQFPKDADVEV